MKPPLPALAIFRRPDLKPNDPLSFLPDTKSATDFFDYMRYWLGETRTNELTAASTPERAKLAWKQWQLDSDGRVSPNTAIANVISTICDWQSTARPQYWVKFHFRIWQGKNLRQFNDSDLEELP